MNITLSKRLEQPIKVTGHIPSKDEKGNIEISVKQLAEGVHELVETNAVAVGDVIQLGVKGPFVGNRRTKEPLLIAFRVQKRGALQAIARNIGPALELPKTGKPIEYVVTELTVLRAN